MHESFLGSRVVVHNPSYTERIDVTEAALSGGAARVGFLVVLPRKIVTETVIRYRYTIVDMVSAPNGLIALIVGGRFQKISIES